MSVLSAENNIRHLISKQFDGFEVEEIIRDLKEQFPRSGRGAGICWSDPFKSLSDTQQQTLILYAGLAVRKYRIRQLQSGAS